VENGPRDLEQSQYVHVSIRPPQDMVGNDRSTASSFTLRAGKKGLGIRYIPGPGLVRCLSMLFALRQLV